MKRTLIIFSMLIAIVCLFAISVSATTFYKDENGTELFECEIADSYHIDSYEIKNGGFAKADSEGNALTWYVISTETVDGNTVKTVKAVKTSECYENGAYTNGVDKALVVSASYDEGTAVVPSFGAYSGSFSKELLFAYIPDSVTTLPARFGQNTPILKCVLNETSQCNNFEMLVFWGAKSLREFYLPKHVKTLPTKDGKAFEHAKRMKTFVIANDTEMETLPSWYFGGTGIESFTVPDSMTYLNSRAFQGMSSLKYVNLGKNLTHIYKTENNHSLFHDCRSLQTVVIPKGLVAENLIDNYGGGFDYTFGSASPIFIYTGTLEDFLAIKAKITAAGNNGGLASATVENGRIVIADHCETFLGGHSCGSTSSIITSYFEKINIGGICTECGTEVVEKTIDAIFTYLGYSCTEKPINGVHSVTQGYGINKTAYNEYVKFNPEFKYGLVASVTANPLDEANQSLVQSGKIIVIESSELAHDYFEIKVNGIGEKNLDTSIVFCAYVNDNGIYYLDNNTTSQEASGISYNGVYTILHP